MLCFVFLCVLLFVYRFLVIFFGGGRCGSNLFSWFWEFVAVVLDFSFFLNKNLKVGWVGTGRGSRRSWGRGRL